MLITLPENSNTVKTSFTVQCFSKGEGEGGVLSSHPCTEEGQIEKSDVSYQTCCTLRATTWKLWVLVTANWIPSGTKV